MHNFEARYRAIVEKRPELACPDLTTDELNQWFYKTSSYFAIPSSIARAAVCLWLAGKLPENIEFSLIGGSCCIETDSMTQLVVNCTDPVDAILTAWEIILGIKEGA